MENQVHLCKVKDATQGESREYFSPNKLVPVEPQPWECGSHTGLGLLIC